MAGTDKKLRKLSDFDTPNTRVEEESDVEKRYTLGNVLGQGTFGTVLKATSKSSGQQYAMKIVNKDKVCARFYKGVGMPLCGDIAYYPVCLVAGIL